MLFKTALPRKSQTSERYESPNFFNRRYLVQGWVIRLTSSKQDMAQH